MQKKKFKVTPLERAWILYDVGNSAFVLMIATLVPIFFNALAEAGGVSKVNYLAYWGYASSVVTVITAVLGPILGTLADTKGFKKPIFMLCLFVGVLGCCAMGAARTWLPFLVIFIVAKIGFSASLVFYDSMLGDVTTPERMDMVSSRGYAWGYIGSCVPFVVCLALVLGSGAIGMSQMTALTIALFITAAWWLVTTLPLLRRYRQVNYVEVEQHAIRQSFVRIGHTLKHLYEDKQDNLIEILMACKQEGNPDMVFKFCSTSKVSFPGSGVAAIGASKKNIDFIKQQMTIQTIGHDKLNQLRHVRFFKDIHGMVLHMRKHADILRPKFETVLNGLKSELGDLEIGSWLEPRGGYFISFDALPGCAKAIVAKAKEAGLVMTPAGATFPYGKDPQDSNIRIAPSYPTPEELAVAVEIFVLCVKLVSVDKLLEEK